MGNWLNSKKNAFTLYQALGFKLPSDIVRANADIWHCFGGGSRQRKITLFPLLLATWNVFTKGTGHNKFVQREPSLSGVEGLSKTPLFSLIPSTKFYWL